MDMDNILSRIGLGWFQIPPIVTSLLILGTYPTQHVSTVFTDMPRNFKCQSSADNSSTYNNLCWISNISDTSELNSKLYLCSEFIYDTELFESTFTSEYNLSCEKAWLSGMFKNSGFAGLVIGCIFAGAGDKWGRVLVIKVITVLYLISVLAVGLVTDMKYVIIARFFVGFCYEILNGTAYILMMEVLPPSHRFTIGAIVANLGYALFAIITGTVSYFIRSWRTLHLILSFPVYLLSVSMFFLHESPRWLIHSGNIEEGIDVLQKGAKLNQVELSNESLDNFKSYVGSSVKIVDEESQIKTCQTFHSIISSLKMLFGSATMCRISVLFPIWWFLTGLIYFSIPLNANNFTSNPFLYVIVTSIAAIPVIIFVYVLPKYFGNVTTISNMFILTMIGLIGVSFIPEHLIWLKWVVILFSMMAISSCFLIGFILGSELFPTPVRSVGFGMGSIARHTGALAVQYVIDLASAERMWWLPNAVAAGCCLMAGALSVGLPETYGQPLCETVEQVENRSKKYAGNKTRKNSVYSISFVKT